MHNTPTYGPSWIRHLREKAEQTLECEMDADIAPHQLKALLHELRVYRIEMEMQNEALRETQHALEEARDRYVDLFEFSPVGYLSLTPAGMINEINLTGTALLGTARALVMNRRFAHFVVSEDRDYWYHYLLDLVTHPEKKDGELRLLRGNGLIVKVRLTGIGLKTTDGHTVVRIALTDIGEQKTDNLAEHTAEQAQGLDDVRAANHDNMWVTDRKQNPIPGG